MLGKVVLLGAVLASSVAFAESVQIGVGRFDIVHAEKIQEGRMVMHTVDLKWVSQSGSANVKAVLYCNTRKGDYYDAKGNLSEIRINAADRDSSITNNLWFRYCPSKGMTKKEASAFKKYD